MRSIHKVTCLVRGRDGRVAVFRHPYAGVQVPAGTVEPGEELEVAAVREAREETGLSGLTLSRYLGSSADQIPDGQLVVSEASIAYARPDPGSFDWARLPRGCRVEELRRANQYVQVRYREYDSEETGSAITFEVAGWVSEAALTDQQERHFFELDYRGTTADQWEVCTDNHVFTLFWIDLSERARLVARQRDWLLRLM